MNIAQKFEQSSITTDTVVLRIPTNKEPIVLIFSQEKHQEYPFITCGPFNPNLPWDVVGLYDYNVSQAFLKPDSYKLDTIMILICNTDLEIVKDNFPPVLEAKAKLCYSSLIVGEAGQKQLKIWRDEHAAKSAYTTYSNICIQQVDDVKEGPIRYTLKHKNAPFSYQLFNVHLKCVNEGVMTFTLNDEQTRLLEGCLFKFLRGVFFSYHSETNQFKCIYHKNEKVIDDAVRSVLFQNSINVDEGFGWDQFLPKKRQLKDCTANNYYYNLKLVFLCCIKGDNIEMTIHLHDGAESSKDFKKNAILCKCSKKATIAVGTCLHPHCVTCGREKNALKIQKDFVFTHSKQQLFQCLCCRDVYWGYRPIEIISLYKPQAAKSKKRSWNRTLRLNEEIQNLNVCGKRKKIKRKLYTSDFTAASKQNGELAKVLELSRRSKNYDLAMNEIRKVNEVRVTMGVTLDGHLIEQPYTLSHKKDITVVLKAIENDTVYADTVHVDYGENPILFYEKNSPMCLFQEYKSRK